MRRIEKYPETETFHYYNANPKNKIAADCVIRAISTALELPWETVVRELTEIGIKYGLVCNEKACYEKYLESKGWAKQKQPRKNDNTKYTGKEWCRYLSINDGKGTIGSIIANIGGHHIVCIKPTYEGDGINSRYKVLDIWDSTSGCIGNYWIKYVK